jgi:hypothetical protein
MTKEDYGVWALIAALIFLTLFVFLTSCASLSQNDNAVEEAIEDVIENQIEDFLDLPSGVLDDTIDFTPT